MFQISQLLIFGDFWQLVKAALFSFTLIHFRSYCEVKRRDVLEECFENIKLQRNIGIIISVNIYIFKGNVLLIDIVS